jgi:hypothetical protein
MRYFNELEVAISSNFGNRSLLAQNVTLNINRSVNSTYVISQQNSSQTIKTKENESTLDFTYFIDQYDPLLNAVNYIRTGVFFNSFPEVNIPLAIKAAGISGMFYPTRYSLSITPNAKLTASVTLNNFSDLSGQLSPKPISNVLLSGSGVAHSWNAVMSGNLTNQIYNVLNFNYDMNINWEPIYSIGQKRPRQLNLSAGQENFTIAVEDADSNFNNTTLSTSKNATLYSYNFIGSQILSINTSGSDIDSASLDVNMDDYARNKLVLKKTF